MKFKSNIEREKPYHFFRANRGNPDIKIYSWTQYKTSVDRFNWHILADNEELIVEHLCFSYFVLD